MKGEPHEWKGNGYHCEECGSSYHCSACSRGSGMMGHYMGGEDGFFACQEPERAEAYRAKR